MIYALVVLYNKKCQDSATICCLEKKKNLKIIIFDNSEKDYKNAEYCKEKNYIYYTLNKNVGLSKAYNYILSKVKFNNKDYLIILDDDTILNDEYFNEIYEKISENKYDILLPMVKSNGSIISPAQVQFGCRVKSVKNKENININKITAINSAMVVKTTVYNKVKYNENLFLDYVDHEFMKQIRKENFEILILNSEIIQNFSRNETKTISSEIFRFKIYIKDFKKYCKGCNNLIYYYINIWVYCLKLSLKYKSNKFIKICLGSDKKC